MEKKINIVKAITFLKLAHFLYNLKEMHRCDNIRVGQ